ncbi:hypothetical protein Tco_1255773 [Tanacetum coccineum]
MERAETRVTSEPGLVLRLVRSHGRIGAVGSLTVGFLRNLNHYKEGNLFFCHKVIEVSVLSFKCDKVLQEVSTSSLVEVVLDSWFRYRNRVVGFLGVQGAQGDREAEVFQVSNDDTAVAQRRLEDKQPEEKTNTNCLVKEQENEYQTGWKIKTGNVLDSCNQRSTQQCTKSEVIKHLGVAGIQQYNRLVNKTNMTLFAKVRCFLIQSGLFKVFWAEDTTMSTYLVNRSPSSAIGFKKPRDMLGFFGWLASIERGMLKPVKVKCIFLGYHKRIVGNKLWRLDDVTSKVVLYRNMGFNESEEYKTTFIGSGVGTGLVQVLQGVELKVEPYREDSNEAAFVVAKAKKIYAHESLNFNDTVAYEEYAPGLQVKAKGDVLGMEIVKDQSGNTLMVHSPDYDVEKNGKWSCIYAVGSHKYQMVCTRLDIASADVGMLDKFDHGLQTNVQALSTTKAGYMMFTEAWKKKIWLKGLLTESRNELRLVAGIATGALVKGGSQFEFPAQFEVAMYRETIGITSKFEKNKSHNVERAESRVTSESGLVCRLLRNRGIIGAAGSSGDRKAEIFSLVNDDNAVIKDGWGQATKVTTNTDLLGKGKEKEY